MKNKSIFSLIFIPVLLLTWIQALHANEALREIRQIVAELPEIDRISRRHIPDDVIDKILSHQPASGNALLEVIANPEDNLNRRATNVLMKIWENLTPEQIGRYFQIAMPASIEYRPQYLQGVEARIVIDSGIKYGEGGWPVNKGLKIKKKYSRYLDGKLYGEIIDSNNYQGIFYIPLSELDIGQHTAQLIVEYEITDNEHIYTGIARSELAEFEIVSSDVPDELAAPYDPEVEEMVLKSLQFKEVQSPRFVNNADFLGTDEPWKPQSSGRSKATNDEWAVHSPLYQVLEPLPVDLCFNVKFVVEETGKKYEGVPITLVSGQSNPRLKYFPMRDTKEFARDNRGFVPLRIVLEPSRDIALDHPKVTHYYNRPITTEVLRAKTYWYPYSSAEPWQKELRTALENLSRTTDVDKQMFYTLDGLAALNPFRRARAARRIGDSRDQDRTVAIPFLIPLLADVHTELQVQPADYAAQALSSIGSPAVPQLIEALESKDPNVREAVAYILASIADGRAGSSLIEALHDSEAKVQIAAITALGQIGDPRAIKPLMQIEQDSDRSIRENVTIALDLIKHLNAIVHFGDLNLENIIRQAIGKPTGEIVGRELLDVGLTELDARSKGIVDLSGLEYCTDLIKLNLTDNRIKDISGLKRLVNLRDLFLRNNEITDINALSKLTELRGLDFRNNKIQSIAPLAGHRNLTVLRISNNQIKDIQPLSGCQEMTYLYLDRNQITDINAVGNMTSLKILEFQLNHITNLKPLSKLPELYALEVSNNPIVSVKPIAKLVNIRHLRMANIQIEYIRDLSGLMNMEQLTLSGNTIKDIDVLRNFPSLSHLLLAKCQIRDISVLAELTNLEMFIANSNEIVDISALAKLPKLKRIWLDDNQIRDIRPLVENENISKETRINLRNNPLSTESIQNYIPIMEGRGAQVRFGEKSMGF